MAATAVATAVAAGDGLPPVGAVLLRHHEPVAGGARQPLVAAGFGGGQTAAA